MSSRTYAWSPEGLADAAKSGVDTAEVIDALYTTQAFEHRVGDLLLYVFGLAQTGRVITVTVRRAEDSFVYRVMAARESSAAELMEWERRTR